MFSVFLYTAKLFNCGSIPLEKQSLEDVACDWLNKDDKWGRKNFERWTDIGVIKRTLIIGGIFPLQGTKYTAPELIPGRHY
jgi:hypothetical protein